MKIQQAAYRKVKVAIKSGVLQRPLCCPRCGAWDRKGSDGRTLIHAHHEKGYEYPLDVQWLCAKCHRSETPLPEKPGAPCLGDRNGMRTQPHRRPYGSRNGYALLTEIVVLDIKRRRKTAAQYAEQYGVSRAAIHDIFQGKRWGWLAAAPEPEETDG